MFTKLRTTFRPSRARQAQLRRPLSSPAILQNPKNGEEQTPAYSQERNNDARPSSTTRLFSRSNLALNRSRPKRQRSENHGIFSLFARHPRRQFTTRPLEQSPIIPTSPQTANIENNGSDNGSSDGRSTPWFSPSRRRNPQVQKENQDDIPSSMEPCESTSSAALEQMVTMPTNIPNQAHARTLADEEVHMEEAASPARSWHSRPGFNGSPADQSTSDCLLPRLRDNGSPSEDGNASGNPEDQDYLEIMPQVPEEECTFENEVDVIVSTSGSRTTQEDAQKLYSLVNSVAEDKESRVSSDTKSPLEQERNDAKRPLDAQLRFTSLQDEDQVSDIFPYEPEKEASTSSSTSTAQEDNPTTTPMYSPVHSFVEGHESDTLNCKFCERRRPEEAGSVASQSPPYPLRDAAKFTSADGEKADQSARNKPNNSNRYNPLQTSRAFSNREADFVHGAALRGKTVVINGPVIQNLRADSVVFNVIDEDSP